MKLKLRLLHENEEEVLCLGEGKNIFQKVVHGDEIEGMGEMYIFKQMKI
jgi:hypothetical protein